jgi:DNA-binding transcriptional ArsR family regulator
MPTSSAVCGHVYTQQVRLSTYVFKTMATDQLSNTFAALADPTRRAILARLVEGESTLTQLAEPFAMSVQAVSRHIKVLERAGLISRGRRAQRRPARLEPRRLEEAVDWLTPYQRLWDASFDRLGMRMKGT